MNTNINTEALNQARANAAPSELTIALAALATLEREQAFEAASDAQASASAPNPWSLYGAAREAATIETHAIAKRASLRAAAMDSSRARVEYAKEAEAQILALASVRLTDELEARANRATLDAAAKEKREIEKSAKTRREAFDRNLATLTELDAKLDPLLADMADLVVEIERKRLEILAAQAPVANLASSLVYEARAIGLNEPRARGTEWDASRATHQKISKLLAAAPIDGWDGNFHAAAYADKEG